MIRTVTAINSRGEDIIMDLRNPWNNGFAITSIKGIDPPEASINNTELSIADGSVFNSSRVSNRNIVIEIKLLPNSTIAETRHSLYKYFPIKKKVRLIFDTDTRHAYIDGYVESNSIEIFDDFETAQISLICPYPYFKDTSDTRESLNSIVSEFTFPFSNPVSTRALVMGNLSENNIVTIDYLGDDAVGIEFELSLFGTTSSITLRNNTTGQSMIIDNRRIEYLTGGPLADGDRLEIGTVVGSKYARLHRGVETYNVLASLGTSPDWVTLEPGLNEVEIVPIWTNTKIEASLIYDVLYEGL